MKGRTAAALGVLLVALLAFAGCGSKSTTTPSTTPSTTPGSTSTSTTGTSVTIRNASFEPATLTVSAGETVTWTNDDTVEHTVTGSGLDSGKMKTGDVYKFTFNTPGTYNYQCTVYPAMLGQVVVTPSK